MDVGIVSSMEPTINPTNNFALIMFEGRIGSVVVSSYTSFILGLDLTSKWCVVLVAVH